MRALLSKIDERRFKNYSRAINTYIQFVNKNNIEYFQIGSSTWSFNDDLHVNASPELGLIVNGQKFYIKNYYKVANSSNKVDQRNTQEMLVLMQIATKNFIVEPDAKYAIFNFNNGKLIEAKPITDELLLNLELDAQFIVNIWNKV